MAETKAMGKVEAKRPSVSDVMSLPGAVREDFPDGSFKIKVNGKRAMTRAFEMTRPWAQAEAARGDEMNGRRAVSRIQEPNGRIRHVPADKEERACKKLHARPLGGRRPTFVWIAGHFYRCSDGQRMKLVSRWPEPALLVKDDDASHRS